jgi:hypothetical protein
LKKYDELADNGLPCRAPVTPAENLTVTLPAYHAGGGMSFDELLILARATQALKPRTIFEIGTYNGLSTAVLLLNSDSNATIVTMDLPTSAAADDNWLPSDQQLVTSRRLGSVPRALGLERYTQLLCDSMSFDPSSYENSVELGLIDAAHDLAHVQNDTLKMARMISDRGTVFWHDYGGKGAFRPLAHYLEGLGKRGSIYRIRDTSLAWARGRDLKKAVGLVPQNEPCRAA